MPYHSPSIGWIRIMKEDDITRIFDRNRSGSKSITMMCRLITKNLNVPFSTETYTWSWYLKLNLEAVPYSSKIVEPRSPRVWSAQGQCQDALRQMTSSTNQDVYFIATEVLYTYKSKVPLFQVKFKLAILHIFLIFFCKAYAPLSAMYLASTEQAWWEFNSLGRVPLTPSHVFGSSTLSHP